MTQTEASKHPKLDRFTLIFGTCVFIFAVLSMALVWQTGLHNRGQLQLPTLASEKFTPITVEPPRAEGQPRYITNATPVSVPSGAAVVAVILDDMGVNSKMSARAVAQLPKEITFAYLPYGSATDSQVQIARNEGHEIMVHMPMAPRPHGEELPADPGPDALFPNFEEEEIKRRIHKNLEGLLPFVVGVNNHMGSSFTASREGMKIMLEIAASEGLFFLDSLTTSSSQVRAAAAELKSNGITLPVLQRHVFIDHYMGKDNALTALKQLEAKAQQQGKAIAIGHPHPGTIAALNDWIPTLKDKNIYLVPISHLISH